MSMRIMVLAMQAKVGNPLRKLVLLKLADNANDKGECFPSYQHLADQCEITRRSVMTHIKALQQQGFLSTRHRKNKDGNSSNLFKLDIEAIKHAEGSKPNSLGGSEGDSLGGEARSLGSEPNSLGGSEGDSPRTSHSSEPVNEPIGNSSESPSDAVASGCATGSKKQKNKRYEAPIEQLVSIYNEVTAGQLSAVQEITSSRKSQINARWLQMKNSKAPNGKIRYVGTEDGLKWWRKYFEKVLMNDTWNGNNSIDFAANFDWVIKQNNFVKVLEWQPTPRQIEEARHAS